MQVKIFRGNGSKALEKAANDWLASLPKSVKIISTQTAAAPQTSPDNPGASRVSIVLTVWYSGGTSES